MCQKVIDYYDTANNPVYKIKCNCGNTACRNIRFEIKPKIKKQTNFGEEFTTEEEKLFYDKVCGVSK